MNTHTGKNITVRLLLEGEDKKLRGESSPARIWKAPVRKKRPPFCKVKSWQKKRKRARQLKMMERIIRAWTD